MILAATLLLSLMAGPCATPGSAAAAAYIDAFVYLGPEPDKDLAGKLPLTAAQQRELDRRSLIQSDPQRTMRARYQGRAQWFRAHPNDFPSRPQ